MPIQVSESQLEGFSDITALINKLDKSKLPQELREECEKMIVRVYRMAKHGSYTSEYETVAKYVDWATRVPWQEFSSDSIDLNSIRSELDKYHYGLEKVKEKILSYMAVMKLREQKGANITANGEDANGRVIRPPVLCFVGLQGLGKTTIAKSIATALGRKFVRISLAAFGNIAQLRGSSKANIDAEPGLILQGLAQSKSMNPVMLLDEIDKSSGIESLRNDIMAALLEILDPAQNEAFTDRYLNYPVDLSKVFFITTANTLGTISAALLDRLEVIRFTSYSDDEKVIIAKTYLMPKVLRDSGLTTEQLVVDEDTWASIVRPMGYDAGIRQLERTLMNLARRAAYEIVTGQTFAVHINQENVKRYLPEDMGVLG